MVTLCAYSLQQGSLRCSRCQLTCYRDKVAQKKHWKLHKGHCKLLEQSTKSIIDNMDFHQAMTSLTQKIRGAGSTTCTTHDIVYLMQHIRKLFDQKADKNDEAEMELHTLARSLVMMPHDIFIASFYAQPGMVNYLLTGVFEDLCRPTTRFIKQELAKYNGIPTEQFVENCITNELERERVLAAKKKHEGIKKAEGCSLFSLPTSMQFCYLYYNCIVAGAVCAGRTMSSIHDGKGRLRASSSDRMLLSRKCLERAMQLWADPHARASCGDAMAPAASLCCTAMSVFQPEGYQLIPGLTLDDAVLTCLSELKECAASSMYSVKVLDAISQMEPATAFDIWAHMPLKERAKVARATAAFLIDEGVEQKEGGYGEINVPANSLKNILFMACETEDENYVSVRRDIWQLCANDEYLGPAACGRNYGCRAYFHFLLRKTVENPDMVLTAAGTIDSWQKTSWPKAGKTNSAQSLEKKACMALVQTPEEIEAISKLLGM